MLDLINHKNAYAMKRSRLGHIFFHHTDGIVTVMCVVRNVIRSKKIVDCLEKVEAQSFSGAIGRALQLQPDNLDMAKIIASKVMMENDLRIEGKKTAKRCTLPDTADAYHRQTKC